jgi:hypothetical protein
MHFGGGMYERGIRGKMLLSRKRNEKTRKKAYIRD